MEAWQTNELIQHLRRNDPHWQLSVDQFRRNHHYEMPIPVPARMRCIAMPAQLRGGIAGNGGGPIDTACMYGNERVLGAANLRTALPLCMKQPKGFYQFVLRGQFTVFNTGGAAILAHPSGKLPVVDADILAKEALLLPDKAAVAEHDARYG
jgi:hypothetical protein